MPKPPALTPADTLGFLIKSHYLGNDIPSMVTTANFAAWCRKNFAKLETTTALLGRTSVPATFSAPWKSARRILSIPQPSSQLGLSIIINDNLEAIRATIAGAKLTLYNTEPDTKNDRIFVGLEFDKVERVEARVLALSPSIMKADIGSFFHTIYSHSIPWGVLTKKHVKDVREKKDKAECEKLDKHWSSQIDRAIQSGNSRETFGIPVGPDTSRMIAELLLAGAQNDPKLAECLNANDGYRLVDDFFVGFPDETAALNCLDALRHSLWTFNLYLNHDKTGVRRSVDLFGDAWKHEIEGYVLSGRKPDGQRQQVQGLLDIVIRHCLARGDSRPASAFCSRILKLNILPANLPFVTDCMLRIGRDYPACIKPVALFIAQYREPLGSPGLKSTIGKWVDTVFLTHGARGHDLELSWALFICGVLQLQVLMDRFGDPMPTLSPVLLSVLGLLSEQSLISGSWDSWNATSDKAQHVARGRNWLPNYEAVLRRWTSDPSIVSEINADPLLKLLLKAKVTFLDDSDIKKVASNEGSAGPVPTSRPKLNKVFLKRVKVRASRSSSNNDYD